MKIKWYGHSAFIITTEAGIRIITDPYNPDAYEGDLSYGRITDEADLVLTSHNHADHNYTKEIGGSYVHLDKAGEYTLGDVCVKALETCHDKSGGKERGRNLLFIISAEGITLIHLGDLGHVLDSGIINRTGHVDVAFVPVGGFFTIDAREAAQVMESLRPAITIPMHFRTDKCHFPIAGPGEFTKGKERVRQLETSTLTITKATIPEVPEIVVLQHAL